MLDEIYKPADEAAQCDLMDLFLGAEAAYADNATRHPLEVIRVEPLVSSTVGPHIYLMEPVMNREQREKYREEMCRLQSLAEQLVDRVGDAAKMRLIVRCIQRVLADVDVVNASRTGIQ